LGVQPLAEAHTHSAKAEAAAVAPGRSSSSSSRSRRRRLVNIHTEHSSKEGGSTALAAGFTPVASGPLGSPRCTTAAGHHRKVDTEAGTIDQASFERVGRQTVRVYEQLSSGWRAVERPLGELWFEDLRLRLLRSKTGWYGCVDSLCRG
jgi:hypothetical protein